MKKIPPWHLKKIFPLPFWVQLGAAPWWKILKTWKVWILSPCVNCNEHQQFQIALRARAELEGFSIVFWRKFKQGMYFASEIFWPLSVYLISKLGLQTRARQLIKIGANLMYIPLIIIICDFQKLKYGINHCSTFKNGQKCALNKEFCTTFCFAYNFSLVSYSPMIEYQNKKQD